MDHRVEKPLVRNRYRRKLGKFFYTIKRKIEWYLKPIRYAAKIQQQPFSSLVKTHQSFLLRPLRDVEMLLQHNKVTNLRLAIQHLNGIVIQPGEVFSFWRLVGNPTKRKGYLPGLILNQGKIEAGIGGGLCQLGNLLFWMAVHSPLTIKERHRHGFDVFPDINRTLPFGSGATLSYNYIDFQLVNNTDQSFQILLWLDEEYLQGEIRSERALNELYEVYESHHQIVHQSWGGYTRHNTINRKTLNKQTAEVLSDDFLLENHAVMMYEPLLSAGTKSS